MCEDFLSSCSLTALEQPRLSSEPAGPWGDGSGALRHALSHAVGSCGLVISYILEVVKNAWEGVTVYTDLGVV